MKKPPYEFVYIIQNKDDNPWNNGGAVIPNISTGTIIYTRKHNADRKCNHEFEEVCKYKLVPVEE